MENQNMTQPPKNHLVKAILTLIFCCLPFGVASLVYATKVESSWALGQKELAQEQADKANKWANYGIWSGVVIGILYTIFMIAAQL